MNRLSNPKSVFIELERDTSFNCIVAIWKGMLSFEDVKEGKLALLDELEETGYHILLNDNRQVLGDWRVANEWIASYWLPKALNFGLDKFAHILSPYYYGKLSAEDLQSRIGEQLEMRIFINEEEARNWIS